MIFQGGELRDVYRLDISFASNGHPMLRATLEANPGETQGQNDCLVLGERQRRDWVISKMSMEMAAKKPFNLFFRIIQVPGPDHKTILGIPELDLKTILLFSGTHDSYKYWIEEEKFGANGEVAEIEMKSNQERMNIVRLEYVEVFLWLLGAYNNTAACMLRCLLYQLPGVLFTYIVEQNQTFDGCKKNIRPFKTMGSLTRKLRKQRKQKIHLRWENQILLQDNQDLKQRLSEATGNHTEGVTPPKSDTHYPSFHNDSFNDPSHSGYQ